MPTQTQVDPDADRSVLMTREFDAPRAVIWQAFTDGKILARWLLGPPGRDMERCEVSLQPGGEYRWLWRNGETGQAFGFHGTYLEVEPEQRLVDKQTIDQGEGGATSAPPTQSTVVFDDTPNGGCRVTTRVQYPDAATRDAILAQGLGEGMEASYQRLDQMLLRAVA